MSKSSRFLFSVLTVIASPEGAKQSWSRLLRRPFGLLAMTSFLLLFPLSPCVLAADKEDDSKDSSSQTETQQSVPPKKESPKKSPKVKEKAPAKKESKEEKPVYQAEPVIVTATRLPTKGVDLKKWAGPATVLSSDDLEQIGGYSAETTLSLQEGVNLVDSNGFGLGDGLGTSVNLRGIGGLTGTNSTLIMVDGVRLNEPFDNATLLNSVPLYTMDRMEIIRGGGSTVFGQGAFGGVINIVTKKPSPKLFEAEVQYVIGSYKEQQVLTQMSGTVKPLSYVVNLSRNLVHGYREFSEDHEGNFDGKVNIQISDKTSVGANVKHFRQGTHSPGTLVGGVWEEDPRRHGDSIGTYMNSITQVAVDGHHQLTDSINLDANWYWRERENDSDFGWGLFRITNQTTGGVLQGTWSGSLFGRPDRLAVGTELNGANVKTGTEGTESSQSQIVGVGVFGENTIDLAERWSLVQAIRYDYARFNEHLTSIAPLYTPFEGILHFNGLSPKVGTNFRPWNWISFFANYSRNFKAPCVQDIDAVLTDPSGIPYRDNPDVSDQTSNDFELGFRAEPHKKIKVDGTLYWVPIHHEILFDPINFRNNNFNTIHRGVELAAEIYPIKRVKLFGNYTFNHAAFRGGDYSGNPIPLTPRHTFVAGTRITLPKGLAWSMRARWVNDLQRLNDFTNSANIRGDDYAVVDMRLEWNQPHWGAFFEIYNLLDAKYSELQNYSTWTGQLGANPQPERGFRGGVRITL